MRLIWNLLCCSKETLLQKCAVMTISCHEIIFLVWASPSSYYFQSYFGRLFHGVSPNKVWGRGTFFPKKDFHGRTNFGRNIYGGIVLHGGTNYQIIQRRARGVEGRSFTWTENPDHFIDLWKGLSLRLIFKDAQRSCHIIWGIDI